MTTTTNTRTDVLTRLPMGACGQSERTAYAKFFGHAYGQDVKSTNTQETILVRNTLVTHPAVALVGERFVPVRYAFCLHLGRLIGTWENSLPASVRERKARQKKHTRRICLPEPYQMYGKRLDSRFSRHFSHLFPTKGEYSRSGWIASQSTKAAAREPALSLKNAQNKRGELKTPLHR